MGAAWALASLSGAHPEVSPSRAEIALPSVVILSVSTVLVTVAGKGTGAAIAAAVAARGHDVVVNYHSDAEAPRSVAAGIVDSGGSAHAVQADVTDPGQVDAMVSRVLAERGGLDAVVLNSHR
jgi:3-oxoacyl-[acyl-carrier protein] reductase